MKVSSNFCLHTQFFNGSKLHTGRQTFIGQIWLLFECEYTSIFSMHLFIFFFFFFNSEEYKLFLHKAF